MNIYNDFFTSTEYKRNGIISIGAFETLHIGHQKLLSDMVNVANKKNLDSYVLTFIESPKKFNDEKNILELADKLTMLEKLGIQNTILCSFTKELKELNPIIFSKILHKNFGIVSYYEGNDFHFGINKSGDLNLLKNEGFDIFTEETFKFDGKKVSTSEIKKYIKSGSIVEANCRLGYNYFIKGVVTKGKQMGRTIGFPTMNIQNNNVLYPKAGSYFTTTEVNNKSYSSMTFVSDSIVETHLIGYKDYTYGFPIRVDFLQKIRDNKPFCSFDELKEQLRIDLDMTKKYFRQS